MVKSDLVTKLANIYPYIYRRDIEKAVDIIFQQIIDAMSEGKRCELRGFGTFNIKLRKAREARNPKTAEKIKIKEKKIPHFKMSKQMKKNLNNFNINELI